MVVAGIVDYIFTTAFLVRDSSNRAEERLDSLNHITAFTAHPVDVLRF